MGREDYIASTRGGYSKPEPYRPAEPKWQPSGSTSGPAGMGSDPKSGKKITKSAKVEAAQSQLAGAKALQRRTMAQLGAGDIDKKEAKVLMGNAMDRIKDSARTLTESKPGTIAGETKDSEKKIFTSKGMDQYNK